MKTAYPTCRNIYNKSKKHMYIQIQLKHISVSIVVSSAYGIICIYIRYYHYESTYGILWIYIWYKLRKAKHKNGEKRTISIVKILILRIILIMIKMIIIKSIIMIGVIIMIDRGFQMSTGPSITCWRRRKAKRPNEKTHVTINVRNRSDKEQAKHIINGAQQAV